jgi:hypothetical protein
MTLDDLLYGETDDACAICGIRGPERLTIHHIDGNHENSVYENTVVLCHNCHQQHHQGKGLGTDKIEDRKRHLIAKTLTQYGLNALKIADRNDFGVVGMPFLLHHLVDMGFMTQEETSMRYGGNERGNEQGWVDVNTRFAITARGRELLRRWFR